MITLVATAVMLVLFVSEFGAYLAVRTDYQLTVDTSRGETMRINLDVTFPSMPCDVVSPDVMDVSGEQHLDVHHNIFKRRLALGRPIDRGRKEDVNGEKNRVDPEERARVLARAKNATEARDEEDGFEEETAKTPGTCGRLRRRDDPRAVLRHLRAGARGVSSQGMGVQRSGGNRAVPARGIQREAPARSGGGATPTGTWR